MTESTAVKTHHLSGLALSAQDYRALRLRGTVSPESRRGKTYFKLRFRTEEGRQRVRYLGSDPVVAEVIRRELQHLQQNRRHCMELRKHVAEARRLLRQVKYRLEDLIVVHGCHFHGFDIRRHRPRCHKKNLVE